MPSESRVSNLIDRVVVITGGANGIGAAVVRLMLQRGANVVVGDIDKAAAARLTTEVRDRWGLDRFGFEVCDVREESDIVHLLKYAQAKFGAVHCMINNAGTGGAFGSLLETSAVDWDNTQAINLRSAFLGTKHAAKMMIEQATGGSIINVSSVAAHQGGAGGAAYSASKAGIDSLTRVAATQLGKHNIRVNAVCPGAIVSSLTHRNIDPDGMMEAAAATQPLGFAGVPDHIAPAFAFLASDDSQFMSGSVMVLDGGYTAEGQNLYSGSHPFGNAIVDRATRAGVGSFDSGIRNATNDRPDESVLEQLRVELPSGPKRCVLITGVSRGLGRELCLRMIDAGHTVVGVARSQEAIEALRNEFPGTHRFDSLDVSNSEQVKAWADDVTASGLVPDLILNNAAVVNELKQVWRIEPDEFQKVMQVNVLGSFYVLRYLLPAMIRQKKGIIVNFSSGWGRTAAAKVSPYCASKWAVEGMTQAIAEELPPTMGVVTLHPGIIQTDTLTASFGESASLYPTPQEWAKVAVPYVLGIEPSDNGKQLSVPGMTTFRGMGKLNAT